MATHQTGDREYPEPTYIRATDAEWRCIREFIERIIETRVAFTTDPLAMAHEAIANMQNDAKAALIALPEPVRRESRFLRTKP